jgi:NDP-sugar pyrophosphorylase family protein
MQTCENKMKAMIFAAGLGTRLQPLTIKKPKALIEIKGIPLLEIIITRLKKYGFNEIIINIHHFADQIENFLKSKHNFDISITLSDERELLLDTGGGLKKAASLFGDCKAFLVHNVDVLTDINLNELYNYHMLHGNLVTLSVRDRKTSRAFLINDHKIICGWKNNTTGETKISRPEEQNLMPVAFDGIHVISPSFFSLITEEGVFSITDTYLRIARSHEISTWQNKNSFWMDLGKIENLSMAEESLNRHETFK